jgi:hypothetical protein
MKEYLKKRQELIEIEQKMHFSYDLESTFTDQERLANEVLSKLKAELKNDHYDITTLDFFQNLVLPSPSSDTLSL